jgi:hypothetical protein
MCTNRKETLPVTDEVAAVKMNRWQAQSLGLRWLLCWFFRVAVSRARAGGCYATSLCRQKQQTDSYHVRNFLVLHSRH